MGKYIEDIHKRYDEGIKFDLTNLGINIPIFFDTPTSDEIKEFKESQLSHKAENSAPLKRAERLSFFV